MWKWCPTKSCGRAKLAMWRAHAPKMILNIIFWQRLFFLRLTFRWSNVMVDLTCVQWKPVSSRFWFPRLIAQDWTLLFLPILLPFRLQKKNTVARATIQVSDLRFVRQTIKLHYETSVKLLSWTPTELVVLTGVFRWFSGSHLVQVGTTRSQDDSAGRLHGLV